MAGQDAIAEIIERFGIIKQIRFKLVQPNDELDASVAVAAVEETFRPLEPRRLEVVASGPKGLNKDEAARKIIEVSEGHNAEILVDGEDKAGLKMKADNEEFALSVPVENPPEDDPGLRDRLFRIYKDLVDAEKVRKLPTPAQAVDKIRRLLGAL